MQSKKKSLTIIGMGMSGLGCAYRLHQLQSQLSLNLLEKSTKTGGRATSSQRNGFIYDYGANYFTFEGL
jgi:protoporphyrinogen oxidase